MPRKPDGDEARTNWLRIRVTDAELEEIRQAARAKGRGKSPSTWARGLLLAAARRLLTLASRRA